MYMSQLLPLILPALLVLTGLAADRPNVILVYMDDMGWGDIGVQDAQGFKTPNLDRMASEGIRLTEFYSICSVCSASRAGLMTGCYASRVMQASVLFPNSKTALHPDEVTIADMLQGAGYDTHMVGKWHLGHQPAVMPMQQGFSSFYGVPYSNDMGCDKRMPLAADALLRADITRENFTELAKGRYPLAPLFMNGEIVEVPSDQATLTKRYTARATTLIREQKDADAPLFLYYAHTMPHKPIFASDDFLGKSERGLYGDVLQEIDWSIGELLKAASELGNTMIFFTSDNGPWNSPGSTAHLRGLKFSNWEGGQRVPTIAWWPGTIPAGQVSDALCSTIDVLPTLAALTGSELSPRGGAALDGLDISPILKGTATSSGREHFFYYGHTCGARPQGVRDARWKLILKVRTKKGQPSEQPPLLYDLDADEAESNNLAAKHPEVVTRLTALIDAHEAQMIATKRSAWQE